MFLQEHLRHWLEAMSMMTKAGQTMRNLQSIIKVSSFKGVFSGKALAPIDRAQA